MASDYKYRPNVDAQLRQCLHSYIMGKAFDN